MRTALQTRAVLRPLTVRRILVPVDFSATSRVALDLGHRLATRFDALLEVLHVPGAPLDEEGMPHAARELEAFTAHLPASPLVTGRVLGGSPPAAAILRAAEDRGVDMIVMGTHGRTGLARLLMGSVTEQVMREARCPVLTVSPRVNERTDHVADVA